MRGPRNSGLGFVGYLDPGNSGFLDPEHDQDPVNF